MASPNIVFEPTPGRLAFKPTGLDDLIPEMSMEVIQYLSPSDATSLFIASSRMRAIFNEHKAAMMTGIIKGQPGIENLLYLYTAQKIENDPDYMLHPRIVNVQCNGLDGPYAISLMGEDVDAFEFKSDVPSKWRTNTFDLTMADVVELWHMVKVVDRWVELWPRIVWRDDPEHRRCLQPEEESRLRKALTRWWLYAHHHHGFYHAWRNFFEPRKWSRDTRLGHIRRLSTDEILELGDVWDVVRDVVSQDLCSSPERICLCKGGYVVDLVPWGAEDGRHERIVSTYMKLGPDQLIYYLEHYSNWKRKVTLEAITADAHMFGRDTESLSVSMSKVLEERMLVRGMHGVAFPSCGIVNEHRASAGAIRAWTNDSSPDGEVPLDRDEIRKRGLPQDYGVRIRRGDDGSDDALPH
ncbi:hypothetical protein GGR52DRAFT_57783 [Hypoxylon sp. FL1284]|nr:hypothetical protein GGR52DRAFT_57783 [Hypoxylon sp. FL1284]